MEAFWELTGGGLAVFFALSGIALFVKAIRSL